jgi:hypothetical protein
MAVRSEYEETVRGVGKSKQGRGESPQSDSAFVGLELLCEYLRRHGFDDEHPRLSKGGSESAAELRRKLLWAVASSYNLRVGQNDPVEQICYDLATCFHQVWIGQAMF